MAIDITSAGSAGSHYFRTVNVNPEENYIYFRDKDIPTSIVSGTSYIFANQVGSLGGVGELVFAEVSSSRTLRFTDIDGIRQDIIDSTPGLVTLNFPYLYNSQLNINMTTPSNQAVKYYTSGDPLVGLTSGETYFLKNVASSFTGTDALYEIPDDTHTFTNAGVTGRVGPTIAEIRAAYSSASWTSQYVLEGDFQGYQDWIVPVSGVYEFTAKGASGYDGSGPGPVGRGAIVRGQVELTKGETITLAIGQVGDAPFSGVIGGSGGGTFIVRKNGNVPLFVAGGGSADTDVDGLYRAGNDAVLTTRGGTGAFTAAGGEDGFGGPSTGGTSAGGGGMFGSASNSSYRVGNFRPTIYSTPGGGGFIDGLTQIENTTLDTYANGAAGGFGGGGSSDTSYFAQSGGGGGYSGGAGARVGASNYAGGGGGSYIISSAINVATSTGSYEDLGTFNGVAIDNIAAYNTGDGSVIMELIEAFSSGNTVHPTAEDAANGTNTVAIQSAGNSYHSFVPINYDIQNDLIYTTSPHGFDQGQAVSFDIESPSPDISTEATYYVDVVDDYSYGLIYSPSVNFISPTGKSTTDVIRRIVVNVELDSLNIPNHGFLQDQPIQYSAGDGDPIVPLVDGATYYISEIVDIDNFKLKNALDSPTSIDFTSPGTGTDHTFIFLTVNTTENTLYIQNHGLVSRQKVRYSNNGGVSVTGLTNDAIYYVQKVDDSTIRLTTDQLNQNIVDLTGIGAGTHSLIIEALDFDTEIITLPNHGFLQGELVDYNSRGQDVITGLESGQTYYVIFVDGDNLKLASSALNAESGIAIDIEESPAGVGKHTLTSLSQTPDGIYEIKSIPTDDTFVVDARGQVPELNKSFNPRSTVAIEENAFYVPAHGFVTGTKLSYSFEAGGAAVGGLANNTDYFAVVVNQDYFKVSTTAEDAASGNTIALTDFGAGISHEFTSTQLNGRVVGNGNVSVAAGSILVNGVGTSFSKILKVGDPFTLYPADGGESFTFSDANVDTGNNRINVAHTFTTGDFVKFNTGGGVAPTPLINTYFYYVGVIDENNFQLYPSKDSAESGVGFITFSSTGSGSDFTLSGISPRGPIVRQITAIGSDIQITVDRPYSTEYSEVQYAYPTFIYVRPSGYSLHRPFDGGVEMSTGAGNSFGQIIRQTRKYFRYQSGKGIQTSFAINFKPSIDIMSMKRLTSTTVECKTRRPHGLISGLFIQVNEAEDSSGTLSDIYNGDFQVSVTGLDTFTIVATQPVPTGTESRSYGFPQFHVTSWVNGALRSGMFDFQNGMFFEFDGQNLYCVRRSSTQQTSGTVSALRGSELIFGDRTNFTAQFDEGDSIVLRGQTYKIIDITDDTTMSVRPEYRGSTGLEIAFDPETQLDIESNTFFITRHGLNQRIPLNYNSIDGESIGGLINGRTYYADVINANSFRLFAAPDSETNVTLSDIGTTNLHSFIPAKSGIIVTKTVDVKVPQSEWNIDKCDGNGVSGYNLNLSRIQMCYMDYSWYGAGKIRFGFKSIDGLVRYVHEFKHNNVLYESYFRSGNLPARYEVVTFENPTYIPSLFHWGTSVIMDGRFDDDRGYLFTAGSQTLDVSGTTTKSFAANGIDLETDLITSLTHGFRTGDVVQFQSIAADGLPGDNASNPSTAVVGSNESPSLNNTDRYGVLVNSPDRIHLTPVGAPIRTFDDVDGGIRTSQSGTVVTVIAADHGLSTGDYVGLYGSTRVFNGAFYITVVDPDTFTYDIHESASFTTPGTFSWTAPEGVTNVSVVAVGGGGGGGQTSDGSGGGGGGGLGWKRRVAVVPGQSYTVVVGSGGNRDTDTGTGYATAQAGGTSYFISPTIVSGIGGGPVGEVGGGTVYRRGGTGGGYTGDGGGFGGDGGNHNQNDRGAGGGGAGGYTGNGGTGASNAGGSAGTGGAGGGGGAGASGLTGGSGGGVGILTAGTSGAGGSLGGNGSGGGAGSGGQSGISGASSTVAAIYGAGGGGSDTTTNVNAGGGGGAVRIIWGNGAAYPDTGAGEVSLDNDFTAVFSEVIDFDTAGSIQYTYFLHPDGSLNNTTGPNYQPLLSLRLSPSVDGGLTGKLGDRDIINRMQVRMQEIGVSTTDLVEVKLILNGRLNNLGFTSQPAPSLIELVEHTPQDTISGGVQVYNFQAEGGVDGSKAATSVNIDQLFELSNSILGGDNIFPDGPDILTVAVSRLTGNNTRTSAKLSWSEAQA
jgi:hypothetical protein